MERNRNSLKCSQWRFGAKLASITLARCLQYTELCARVLLYLMFLLTERKRGMENERLQAKVCYVACVCVGGGGDTV